MAMSLMISGERIGRGVRRAAASVEQPEVYRVGSREGPRDGGLGEGSGGDHWGDDDTVLGCLVDGAAGGTKRADGSAAMVSWRPGDGNHCSRAQRPARSHARLYSSPSRACPLAHVLATISHVCTLARVLPRMCTPSRACFPLHACGRRQAAYAPNASACLKPPPTTCSLRGQCVCLSGACTIHKEPLNRAWSVVVRPPPPCTASSRRRLREGCVEPTGTRRAPCSSFLVPASLRSHLSAWAVNRVLESQSFPLCERGRHTHTPPPTPPRHPLYTYMYISPCLLTEQLADGFRQGRGRVLSPGFF